MKTKEKQIKPFFFMKNTEGPFKIYTTFDRN
jgi:hypothetical protein